MQYLLPLVIYINILLTFIGFVLVFIHKVKAKSHTNIKHFYINNIMYNFFCLFIYLSFLTLFFYGLTIYRYLDLKIIYNHLSEIILAAVNSANLYTILGIILMIPTIIIIILIMLLIRKHLHHQIYNLWFYIIYNYAVHSVDSDPKRIIMQLARIGRRDLIAYSIWEISFYIEERRCGYIEAHASWAKELVYFYYKWGTHKGPYEGRPEGYHGHPYPWYHHKFIIKYIIDHKFYRNFMVPFSPLLILLYDCFFNNLIITHVYFYLLFYVPLMLFKKVTTLVSFENIQLGPLLWDLLYKRETCIYALNSKDKVILNKFIKNGLSYKGLEDDVDLLVQERLTEIYVVNLGESLDDPFGGYLFRFYCKMHTQAQYIYYEEENVYHLTVQLSTEIGKRVAFTRFGDEAVGCRYSDDPNQLPEYDIRYIIAIKHYDVKEDCEYLFKLEQDHL
jgi:hypothetical protein